MEKHKHSHLVAPTPPKVLFFKENRTYISQLPAQECSFRLIEARQEVNWLGSSVLVNASSKDENEFMIVFCLEEKLLRSWFVGEIKPQDQTSTLITGKCGIDYGIAFYGFIFLAILVWAVQSFLLMMELTFACILLFILASAFSFVLWLFVDSIKSNVFTIIENRLNARQVESTGE